MKFKAVIFDLDDTLYNEFGFIKSGYQAVAEYLSGHYGYEKSKIFCDILDYYRINERKGLFDYIIQKYQVKGNGVLDELVRIYRTHAPRLKLSKDAILVINKLKSAKIKTGLITDGLKSVQQSKVLALGLDKLLDNIIFTDDLGPGSSKPSTASFKLMCETFGLRFDDCCYVGDNPLKDFSGPNKLNMASIRLNRGIYKDIIPEDPLACAKFTVSSLDEIFLIK